MLKVTLQGNKPGKLSKFLQLVNDREKALNVKILRATLTNFKGVVLAYRPYDNSFIVWSVYYHGIEDRCSYDGFSSGDYDLTLVQALNEFKNRLA